MASVEKHGAKVLRVMYHSSPSLQSLKMLWVPRDSCRHMHTEAGMVSNGMHYDCEYRLNPCAIQSSIRPAAHLMHDKKPLRWIYQCTYGRARGTIFALAEQAKVKQLQADAHCSHHQALVIQELALGKVLVPDTQQRGDQGCIGHHICGACNLQLEDSTIRVCPLHAMPCTASMAQRPC